MYFFYSAFNEYVSILSLMITLGICGNFSGVQKVMITDGLKNSKKYNHEKRLYCLLVGSSQEL